MDIPNKAPLVNNLVYCHSDIDIYYDPASGLMPMNDDLKDLVLQGVSSVELKREAIRLGMKTLRQSALTKLLEGTTTISEVIRCSAAD